MGSIFLGGIWTFRQWQYSSNIQLFAQAPRTKIPADGSGASVGSKKSTDPQSSDDQLSSFEVDILCKLLGAASRHLLL